MQTRDKPAAQQKSNSVMFGLFKRQSVSVGFPSNPKADAALRRATELKQAGRINEAIAELASFRLSRIKAKGAVNQDCPFNCVTANQLVFAALILAQRALCAAATLARPSALIVRFFFAGLTTGVSTVAGAPRTVASSFSRLAIFSLMSAACLNCV